MDQIYCYCCHLLFLFTEVNYFVHYQNLTLMLDKRDCNKEIYQFTESLLESVNWRNSLLKKIFISFSGAYLLSIRGAKTQTTLTSPGGGDCDPSLCILSDNFTIGVHYLNIFCSFQIVYGLVSHLLLYLIFVLLCLSLLLLYFPRDLAQYRGVKISSINLFFLET